LTEEGYHVHQAGDGQEAIEAIDQIDFDLVLTDIQMPRVDGMAVLQHVRQASPQTFVAVMTAYASVDTAVMALQLGAQDYLLKPIVFEDLLRKVNLLMDHKHLAWELQMLRRELHQHLDLSEFVGRSPAMQRISALLDKVAPATATVLITGESGVGKEVVARAIHTHSPRREKMFIPVNCSAIPENLLESQLFGYVKGAFTGAANSQEGIFPRAQGGTVFLDEIGEMPLALQPKLLRVIEGKEVLPVGATSPTQVDVRILAATNRDLEKEVTAGRFREDLYYRLNVLGVQIPPLRERREDIPLLVEHFIRRHNREMKANYRGVDSAAMKVLIAMPWKGNVRELENVIERAMILGNSEWITPEDLPEVRGATVHTHLPSAERNLKAAVRAYEKSHIERMLQETGGDRTRAAELLGLSRSSLYRKMEQLGIPLEENLQSNCSPRPAIES
jgi:DNA-binding NtrC family response regulator